VVAGRANYTKALKTPWGSFERLRETSRIYEWPFSDHPPDKALPAPSTIGVPIIVVTNAFT
jgi:hypothetical protein